MNVYAESPVISIHLKYINLRKICYDSLVFHRNIRKWITLELLRDLEPYEEIIVI